MTDEEIDELIAKHKAGKANRNRKLAEAIKLRDMWKEAYMACSTGKSYTIGTRRLTSVDTDAAYREMMRWENAIADIETGRNTGIRVRRALPLDF